ncbi:srh-50 [Pristionchus pacificus]|uniref:G protein-coupled receptor n=1 Tax=Pristionchus pacificus TaxID=54126 RepID=A0A2A6BIV6_PRIPA|nr:srh-50 [Pristionchus pacificus]|eukprot:PDM65834.1 G protein-coupled receptor [Pristionchus pacificus]
MTPKDSSLFIPIAVEEEMDLMERVLFGISCFLHVPALFCLLKATPPHQAQIKPFLIACQVSVVISDVYYSLFFEPTFVPEVDLIYCTGFLCRIAATSTAMGIYIYAIGALALSSLACIIARHQGMMPITSRWKMTKKNRRAMIVGVLMAFTIPTTTFTVFPFDMNESDRLINESSYDLDWVRERGRYIKLPSNIFMHAINWSAITCFIGTLVIAISLFTHMFYVLNHETVTSTHTKALIRLSLKRLSVQLNVPILLIAIPLIVLFLQIETRCFPIKTGTAAMFLTPFHPIVHNFVLLIILPTYRNAIVGAVRNWRNPSIGNGPMTVRISITTNLPQSRARHQ